MSLFKNIKSCKKVGKAAPRARHAPRDLRDARNCNKNIYLIYSYINLYAQLLLTAENEHPACGIDRGREGRAGAGGRPSPLSYRKSNISVFVKKIHNDIVFFSLSIKALTFPGIPEILDFGLWRLSGSLETSPDHSEALGNTPAHHQLLQQVDAACWADPVSRRATSEEAIL